MILYDPPAGWKYGFPKPYKPLDGETFAETLLRDGYPQEGLELAMKHTRFMGDFDELQALKDSDET